jgi:hypothetical protein
VDFYFLNDVCITRQFFRSKGSLRILGVFTGIFGVPKRLVAETAYEALMAFDERIRKPGVKRYLREIHFVNIDADTTQVFIDTFNSLRSTPVHRDDSTVTYTQTQRGRTTAMPGPDSLMPGARRRVDESPERVDTVIKVGVVRRGRRSTSEPRKPRRSSSIGDDNAQSADAADAAAAAAGASDDDCVICLGTITDPKRLPCGHTFCADCIKTSFDKCQPKCPSCGKLFGVMNGNQPEGTMVIKVVRQSLAGFERFDTIVIDYDIPSGIQDVSSSHCSLSIQTKAASSASNAHSLFQYQRQLVD